MQENSKISFRTLFIVRSPVAVHHYFSTSVVSTPRRRTALPQLVRKVARRCSVHVVATVNRAARPALTVVCIPLSDAEWPIGDRSSPTGFRRYGDCPNSLPEECVSIQGRSPHERAAKIRSAIGHGPCLLSRTISARLSGPDEQSARTTLPSGSTRIVRSPDPYTDLYCWNCRCPPAIYSRPAGNARWRHGRHGRHGLLSSALNRKRGPGSFPGLFLAPQPKACQRQGPPQLAASSS